MIMCFGIFSGPSFLSYLCFYIFVRYLLLNVFCFVTKELKITKQKTIKGIGDDFYSKYLSHSAPGVK